MRAPPNPTLEWLLWPALAIALSPTLAERARWLAVDGNPYGSIALAPLLLGLLWLRDRSRAPAPRRVPGAALLALGLGCQAFGLLSGTVALATLAIPAGVVGLACFVGRPRPSIALLSLWVVPIPDTFLEWGTPRPETRLLEWAASPWQALGASIELAGPVAHCGGGRLELSGYDLGASLAFFGAGLGLFVALCRDVDALGARLRAMLLGAAGLALCQPLAVSLAVGALCLGFGGATRAALDTGPWLLAGVLAVALCWRPDAPEPSPHDG